MKLAGQPLVIASHNKGKVKEIGELIAPLGLRVMSAAEAGVSEPEETGKTFAENALLKARHAARESGLPALSDDSGLVVPAIGGMPGIYSARWAGADKNFAAAFERIRKELTLHDSLSLRERVSAEGGRVRALTPADAVPSPKGRGDSAYFICALALAFPGGSEQVFEGRVDGTLTFPPRGDRGFGYDPIFIPSGHAITFGEMDPLEKNRISHRASAFAQFLDFVKREE